MNKKEMITMMVTKIANNLTENKDLTYNGHFLIEDVSYNYELTVIKEIFYKLANSINDRIKAGMEIREIEMKKIEVLKIRAAVLKENIKNSKF